MPRFYDPQDFVLNQATRLGDNAAHHALRVLRMQPGDSMTLFNGQGGEWQARLLEATGKQVKILPEAFIEGDRSPALKVHLWLPLIKGERLDWALQKATEMGAASIQLYTSERTEVRLKAQRLEKKLAQWRHLLIAACEQCGLNRPPQLLAPRPLAKLWPEVQTSLKLIALPGNEPLAGRSFTDSSLTLLTGPEGGFAASELELAAQQGFTPFSLGERVLRAETAPVALLAALYTRHERAH